MDVAKPMPACLAAAIVAATTWSVASAADGDGKPGATITAPSVKVIGVTPLPGVGLPLYKVPGNVQSISAREVRAQQAISLPEAMLNNLPSVNVNDVQGNPYQPDVNYRGFTASPLLGLPQGLSVFMDGVRMNEAFGDVVNWALIPMDSIETVSPNVSPATQIRGHGAGSGHGCAFGRSRGALRGVFGFAGDTTPYPRCL